MDHSYIEEQNIIARYEMGKLSPADRERFEEHFVDCPECQEQLAAAEGFRQGLKTVLAQDAIRSPLAIRFSRFDSLASWRVALLGVAACIVLAAIPATLLLRDMRQMHRQLGLAEIARQEWQRRFTEERQARADLEQRLHEIERQVQDNSAKLPVVASIFPLNTVRSPDDSASEPVNKITVPRSLQWVVFSLDLDDGQSRRSYRVALSDSGGRVLWKQDHVTPASANTVGIGMPSSLFHEGDYRLTLEGLSSEGHAVLSRTYPFRIRLAK
jgi:Putative zinc-finger